MSYHVRNPIQKALRQQRQAQRNLQLEQQDVPSLGWTIGNGRGKYTDTSKDSGETSNDENKVVQLDKAVTAKPNQPVVTYSTRKPNYPTGYSCAHSLLYARDDRDQDVKDANAMLSFSEDSDDVESIALEDTPVQLSLEVELSTDKPGDYDEIVSNVEALQWAMLHKISADSGLSKGCKIESQYDEQSMVNALTNMNDMRSSFTKTREISDDLSSSSNNNSSSYNSNNNQHNRYSNSNKNRRRTRELTTNLSSLPYPTSLYSIASTRPKWTASCSNNLGENKETISECYTAQISFDAKYRGSTAESTLIEEYIQGIIHNQLALDAKQLFAEEITGLRWISNDDASSVFDGSNLDQGTPTPIFFGPDFTIGEDKTAGVDNVMAPTNGQSDEIYASILIPLSTAVILGAIWICTHLHYMKRRKNRNKKNDGTGKSRVGSTGSPTEKDIESGSVSTGVTREALSSKGSGDTQDSQESKTCTKMIAKAVGLSTAASSVLGETRSRSTTSRPVSVDSPERSAAGLPPRPMTSKRVVSKQLKKQRKKKKRKKKPVLALTRINSRDGIVEMPMISESDSEADSECTSGDEEYCDDGSSYASSGCMTPNRSSAQGSRSSSRASSPQKSPRQDLIPPDSEESPGYEFLMEAPELKVDTSKNLVIGVDENLPPNLALRPRSTKSDSDDSRPRSVDGGSNGSLRDRRSLEIDTSLDLNSPMNRSFTEENVSVMERMLPLPWLAPDNGRKNRMS